MKPYIEFETERLILKPTNEKDAAFIYALMNSTKWIEFIGDRNITSHEVARKYIVDKIKSQYDRLGFSNYTLIRKTDGAKIGSCGLYDRPGVEGIDIGFALLTEFESNGYGFESANKIMELAFNEFGLTEINAVTSKLNIPSQKLLEKLGLTRLGTIVLPGEEEELFKYRITHLKEINP